MEKSSIIHKSDSIYSHAVSEDEIELRLLTKKDDNIKKVELVYNNKYQFHEFVETREIAKTFSDDVYDYYVLRLKLKDKRFAYIYKLTDDLDNVYYFSESGITKSYDIKVGFYDFFQVSYINSSDIARTNKYFQNRVFYQIFVDRFYKSDKYSSPRINIKWGDKVDRNTIAGGNLLGIKEKLDYLKDLGIDALYLTPIFSANSNHKYDTIDYYKIDKDFGTAANLKDLINEIHQNDMVIVLDGVFNHISYESNMFKDVIKKGNKSKYYDWFVIHGDKVIRGENFNYEAFAYCEGLPKLNLNNLEVQKYIINIGKYYVGKYKIDGFRLDVSDEVPHDFWIKFKKEMLKINPNFILIGENWHNSHSFLNSGKEFDSVMNYSITKDILKFIAKEEITPKKFVSRIYSNLARYKSNVNYNLLNLISSHDVDRFLAQCNEDEDKLLLGYAFLFMHVGIPCIYYGDEIGITGGYDPDNRRCFNWESNDKSERIRYNIKRIINIHKTHAINEKGYEIYEENNLVVLRRKDDKECISLIMNMSKVDKDININGTILHSNLYQDNILKNKGFIIFKEEH